MRWDNYDTRVKKLVSALPGGTALADRLISALDLEAGYSVLDLCPGDGILAAVIAKEFGVQMTAITGDAGTESEVEESARHIGVSENVRVIPATPTALPVSSEEFMRIFCLGSPFFATATPETARELHRVLDADGMIALAGATSIRNETPVHMRKALEGFPGVRLRTPAYTALLFSREGFHIVKAEYIPQAWDHFRKWLDETPGDRIPDSFRRAAHEDGGRWLSLGLILLRKPPRPEWAV